MEEDYPQETWDGNMVEDLMYGTAIGSPKSWPEVYAEVVLEFELLSKAIAGIGLDQSEWATLMASPVWRNYWEENPPLERIPEGEEEVMIVSQEDYEDLPVSVDMISSTEEDTTEEEYSTVEEEGDLSEWDFVYHPVDDYMYDIDTGMYYER